MEQRRRFLKTVAAIVTGALFPWRKKKQPGASSTWVTETAAERQRAFQGTPGVCLIPPHRFGVDVTKCGNFIGYRVGADGNILESWGSGDLPGPKKLKLFNRPDTLDVKFREEVEVRFDFLPFPDELISYSVFADHEKINERLQ